MNNNTKYSETKYNVFVYCGGKCGSSTLTHTLNLNGFNSLHTHSNEEFKHVHCTDYYNNYKSTNINTIEDIINCQNFDNVYIIDVYRTQIERKISSFFQNIIVSPV